MHFVLMIIHSPSILGMNSFWKRLRMANRIESFWTSGEREATAAGLASLAFLCLPDGPDFDEVSSFWLALEDLGVSSDPNPVVFIDDACTVSFWGVEPFP
jgi:hypothetical protein